MKCATSTLHDQLARQPGIFMSTPKEPNFFSDDDQWARGPEWYASLFEGASGSDLRGESSTHYTKLPTHPDSVERAYGMIPDARLVYVMRDPVQRLVSQYIHEWSMRNISEPIDEAVRTRPELLAYSRYAMQLRPWIDRFGADRVLPVFFERLTADPQREFERVCAHIGYQGTPEWQSDAQAKNVSAQRTRRSPVRDRILAVGVFKTFRRTLLPESVREKIKSRWRMEERPQLSEAARALVIDQLDPDMGELGRMLGINLDCAGFKETVRSVGASPEWVPSPAREAAGA